MATYPGKPKFQVQGVLYTKVCFCQGDLLIRCVMSQLSRCPIIQDPISRYPGIQVCSLFRLSNLFYSSPWL